MSYIVYFFVECWFAKQRLVRIFEKFEIIEKVSLSRANLYLTKHNDDFYDYCVRYSLSCTAIQNFKNYIINSEIEPFVQGIDFPIDKEQEILPLRRFVTEVIMISRSKFPAVDRFLI